jgi:hypothetical protein
VAEDPVRSEKVSGADLPAICDLQGDFQKLQGEPVLLLSSFLMVSLSWKEFSLPLRSREHFLDCREDFGNCREQSSVGVANEWQGLARAGSKRRRA